MLSERNGRKKKVMRRLGKVNGKEGEAEGGEERGGM
jgi:hypothetical protein